MGVTSRDHGYDALLKRALGMKPVVIASGILVGAGGEPKRGPEGDEPITLIEVAAVNEFGSSDGHVPERSFIRAPFDENEPKLREKLTVLMREVLEGKLTRDQALERMGLYCVGMFQKRIAEGIPPENRPSTVAAKGGGSTTPLIDTGQLRSSISYEVREGGAK